MKLICISLQVDDDLENQNQLWKYLTLNKEYECIDTTYYDGMSDEYRIIADDGNEGLYPVSNFTTKWQIREDKLNQLGI